MELTVDSLLDWMAENLPKGAMADLLDAVELAGDRANQMVQINALAMPATDELVFDKVFYHLRDRLDIQTRNWVGDEGIETWMAYRDELAGTPGIARDTECSALAALLRLEVMQDRQEKGK